jgi:hypothetical protein
MKGVTSEMVSVKEIDLAMGVGGVRFKAREVEVEERKAALEAARATRRSK